MLASCCRDAPLYFGCTTGGDNGCWLHSKSSAYGSLSGTSPVVHHGLHPSLGPLAAWARTAGRACDGRPGLWAIAGNARRKSKGLGHRTRCMPYHRLVQAPPPCAAQVRVPGAAPGGSSSRASGLLPGGWWLVPYPPSCCGCNAGSCVSYQNCHGPAQLLLAVPTGRAAQCHRQNRTSWRNCIASECTRRAPPPSPPCLQSRL